jgi:hypothetical protein
MVFVKAVGAGVCVYKNHVLEHVGMMYDQQQSGC